MSDRYNLSVVVKEKENKNIDTQNENHVKHLQNFLPYINKDKFCSIIVFGRKAELKKLSNLNNIPVIKHQSLIKELNKNIKSKEDIDNLYQELKQYTNVSENIKKQHVKNIMIK